MLKGTRISHRLVLGFGVIIAMTMIMGLVSYRSMNELSDLTTKLYRHPLTVSNAVLEANMHIIAMHRAMKDLVLAETPRELESSISEIDHHESEVLRHFAVVRERFLGAPTQVEAALDAFQHWRPIREEAVYLMREGQKTDATALIKGRVSEHRAEIGQHMDGLIEFAQNKAKEFMRDSDDQRYRTNVFMAAILAVLVLFGSWIAFAITRGITRPLDRITGALTSISSGAIDVRIIDVERNDEIGAMARAADVFKSVVLEVGEKNWIKTNVAAIAAAMQQAEEPRDFAEAVMSALAPLVEAGHAVFHMYQPATQRLHLIGSYGYRERKEVASSYALGQGLLGQCALERKTIVLTSAPADYVRISSGLGEASPLTILAVPLVHRGRLQGVIELASFKSFSGRKQALVDELAPVAAVSLENLRRASETRELLEQSQAQADLLKANEEELQVQSEELQASNEELRAKSEALEQQAEKLRSSQEELTSQSEALQASNEELREKTEALETRKAELELARTELERKARDLTAASQYKSDFLANMSHELRTPLNSLLILARNLGENEDGNLTEDQIESINIIHDSGTDLLELINDILDLSKVEAGKLELHPGDMDLGASLKGLQRRFSHVAETRGVALRLTKADDVPAFIHTDAARVEQILNNLISNAFKFTERGEVAVTIRRPTSEPDESPESGVCFEVRDTGIGIPEEKREQIFRAFEQVDGTTSRRYGGTGLGLSIAREMARILGGSIHLRSVVGEGSTFTLVLPETLPVNKDHATTVSAPPPPPAAPAVSTAFAAPAIPSRAIQTPNGLDTRSLLPSPPLVPDDREAIGPGDKAIVVVEDDPAFAKILRDLARRKGFKCLVAGDGRSGLLLARQYLPTGIVLDVGLPDTDGWTVLGMLKSDPATRHVPVHFMSARDESGRGMEKGAAGYLTKPVTKEQIEGAFERIEHFAAGNLRRLLVVEDDPTSRRAIVELVGHTDVEIVAVASGEAALEALIRDQYDCVILDLGLPGINGYEFLDQAARDERIVLPPVVIYSGRDLTEDEMLRLREYTDSIVIKGARSPERLVDEVTLFLHSVHDRLPAEQRRILRASMQQEDVFAGKQVLVVDDDMRNTFALAKTLRGRGFTVLMAKDGEKALAQLDANPQVDLVLMDIMMPGMDGYQTTAEIRKQERFNALPIIAVTAKAMLGDREKCLAAGANDYLAKPIDMDKLLTLMRVWLRGTGREA